VRRRPTASQAKSRRRWTVDLRIHRRDPICFRHRCPKRRVREILPSPFLADHTDSVHKLISKRISGHFTMALEAIDLQEHNQERAAFWMERIRRVSQLMIQICAWNLRLRNASLHWPNASRFATGLNPSAPLSVFAYSCLSDRPSRACALRLRRN